MWHIGESMSSDDELWRAFQETRFNADVEGVTIEIRVGEECSQLAELLERKRVRSWCYITAWNPGVERPTLGENQQRNADLLLDLRAAGCEVFDGRGIGEDPGWEPEESFLALGIPAEQAVELGRRYGQYAIVAGEFGEPAKLIDCRLE